MNKKDERYQAYLRILEHELIPATGCTEPIALAYCAALARDTLGMIPEYVEIEASGNIIKNVKSVIVPNTNGLKGMEAAAAIGILAGKADRALEVLSDVTEEQRAALPAYMQQTRFHVSATTGDNVLEMMVRVHHGKDHAAVRIAHQHTNVVYIEKNGSILFQKDEKAVNSEPALNYQLLSVRGIYDFALSAEIEDVRILLSRQIAYNTAVSEEGLQKNYGANVGAVLLDVYGKDIRSRAKAKAAAGSDARMNGSELPVIINSGSGNQGLAASLPVIEYARDLQVSEEQLYRALLISNLTAIHQKTGIGALSAYCGAVSAGAAAGAGIAFLQGGDYEAISHTIVNALAITSGIVCDGAKASCGDGLVSDGVEKTIRNIGLIGREGMRETDKEILCIMTCFD